VSLGGVPAGHLLGVARGRGRPGEGEVSTDEALVIVAEAFTGWSR